MLFFLYFPSTLTFSPLANPSHFTCPPVYLVPGLGHCPSVWIAHCSSLIFCFYCCPYSVFHIAARTQCHHSMIKNLWWFPTALGIKCKLLWFKNSSEYDSTLSLDNSTPAASSCLPRAFMLPFTAVENSRLPDAHPQMSSSYGISGLWFTFQLLWEMTWSSK